MIAMKYGRCGERECNCCEFDATPDEASKTCECGHKRCFHLPPSRAQNNIKKSISEIVRPVFEQEVNQYLEHNLPSCLPCCRMSDIRSRQIESEDGTGTLLEIDSFGYIFEDELMYGTEMRTSGIYLVTPRNCGQRKPTMATQKLFHSPGAQERKLEKMAEKYIIGESYSGQSEGTVIEKVHTLEARIRKMVDRHKEKHNGLADDTVACAIGAALLCFSSGTKERIRAHTYFSDILYKEMSSTKTPSLWRLAQARRLYLLVLSSSENPYATTLRNIAGMYQSMQASIESVQASQAEMRAEMRASQAKMRASQAKMRASQAEMREIITRGFKELGVTGSDPVKDSASRAAVAAQGAKTVSPPSRNKKQQRKRLSTNSSPAGTPCKFGDACRNLRKGNCRYFHPPEHQQNAAAKGTKE